MRAAASVAPPGGNGTTMRTGFEGQAWAWAGPAASARTAPASAMRHVCFMGSLLGGVGPFCAGPCGCGGLLRCDPVL
ncbi:hypothetical protein G6F57_018917 [Rhizopus arrhizus]|uniref:Uncharacterized protein n=1 Tax=Rhizopus delemar TaxID=936053 RepID=A0A9P6XUN4_9FUNG|nr:hypothetical protein G6F57_018917 [Rhizopus arrhizus]KAG1532903.1 hypothetical protein G6F50_016051 [Rhizopus delemar]